MNVPGIDMVEKLSVSVVCTGVVGALTRLVSCKH